MAAGLPPPAQTVNTSGWFVVMNDAGMASEGVNDLHPGEAWDLPATMAAGEVATVDDNGSFGYNFPGGQGVVISTSYGHGWILISNPAGQIMDFVAWGYSAAELATLNVDARGFNFKVGAAWSGDGMSNPPESGVRTGNKDNDSFGDWAGASGSPNSQNGGLVTPFALTSLDDMRPPPPPLYPHGNYIQEANQILHFSAKLDDRTKMIADGDPAEQILEVARKLGVGLIVMTTHGRGALGRWAFGSVADAVSRRAPVPVMIIRPQEGEIPPHPRSPGRDATRWLSPLGARAPGR